MKFFLIKTCLRSGWFIDINDNAVGLFVGFITGGIAAISAARNTGKVTPPSLLQTVGAIPYISFAAMAIIGITFIILSTAACFVDFHSLKHTLASNLARRNVNPRIAMHTPPQRHSADNGGS